MDRKDEENGCEKADVAAGVVVVGVEADVVENGDERRAAAAAPSDRNIGFENDEDIERTSGGGDDDIDAVAATVSAAVVVVDAVGFEDKFRMYFKLSQ